MKCLEGGDRVNHYRNSVLIAPYSPSGRAAHVHLGAARKIEFVIELLTTMSDRVTLVNSAHNGLRWRRSRTAPLVLSSGVTVMEHIPFEIPIRPIGKVLNMLWPLSVTTLLRRLKPDLLWLYNGHAFECIVTLIALRTMTPSVIVEIEDDHRARSRGLSPKPWIDRMLLDKTLPYSRVVTAVNGSMLGQYSRGGAAELLFPGAVSTELLQCVRRRPFSGSRKATAAYFGGLDREKGADVVLDLIRRNELPDWQFIVCGAGPLLGEFRALAASIGERLSVHHGVPPRELYELMDRADVVINPHTSIVAMRDGIFPFKVLEAVAAGRLVVSTDLPACRPDLTDAVYLFDGTSDDLALKLAHALVEYRKRQDQVLATSMQVREFYSLEGMRGQIMSALSARA